MLKEAVLPPPPPGVSSVGDLTQGVQCRAHIALRYHLKTYETKHKPTGVLTLCLFSLSYLSPGLEGGGWGRGMRLKVGLFGTGVGHIDMWIDRKIDKEFEDWKRRLTAGFRG